MTLDLDAIQKRATENLTDPWGELVHTLASDVLALAEEVRRLREFQGALGVIAQLAVTPSDPHWNLVQVARSALRETEETT